jgi:hypothetical protein
MIMKRITSMLVLLLALCTTFGQEIPGTWTGKLSTPNGELTVNFNISATDDGFTSTLDSPDQNAFGIPVDSTFYKKPELIIKVTNLGVEFVGTLEEDDTVKGKFNQMGQTFDLNLVRKVE